MSEDDQAVCARLEQLIAENTGSSAKVTNYARVGGGYSHITGRFSADVGGEYLELVERREQPPERTLVASDRRVEWAVLRHLSDTGSKLVPQARWYDDGTVMGARTIISDFAAGTTLTSQWPLADGSRRARLLDLVAEAAASIATIDPTSLPEVVERPRSWDTYIDGMVDLWRQTEARFVEHNPFLRYVAAWLEANRPAPAPLRLVHGDFQSPNLLVSGDDITVIDWEFPHVGDVREDLGWLRMIDGMSSETIYRGNEDRILSTFRERTGLGEDIINERAVTYFSIISILRVTSMLYDSMGSMAQGNNVSLSVAYSSCVVTLSHDEWFRQILELDGSPSGGAE